MFCGCELIVRRAPNTRTCPVCLGLPGHAAGRQRGGGRSGLEIGLALGCELAPRSIFHRKNYFYPDLAKGYQISQYDMPLCRGGRLGDVRIHRVHLEEDAAKLVHIGAAGASTAPTRVVDFNRGGTPLVEIVTEPDIHSPEQAREWLALLRVTLRQLGVCDVNMEEGSLRADANVSLRPPGSTELGTKTELKNMNSFRFVEPGIRAEIARQAASWRRAGRWSRRRCTSTRLGHADAAALQGGGARLPLLPRARPRAGGVDRGDARARARAALPELPAARDRALRGTGAGDDTARLLAFRPERGVLRAGRGGARDPRRRQLGRPSWPSAGAPTRRLEVTPEALGELVAMVAPTGGHRRRRAAACSTARRRRRRPGGDRRARGARRDGRRRRAGGHRRPAIEANPDAVESIRAGRAAAIGKIVGHVMRETKGRADGGEVSRMIREQLGA